MTDDPRTYGSLEPEAALSLVGTDVRASILWTFSELRGGDGPPPVLSFSELREHTDVDVDSSQFNYHLQQLVGTFVERLDATDDAQVVSEIAGDADEGYRLRPEGTTFVRTIRAWTSGGDHRIPPFELDHDCHHCGHHLEAEYDNAIFAIRCPDCEYVYDYNLTPPGILDADTDRVLDRVAAYNRTIRLAFARGHCPYCGHDVDATFQHPENTGYPRSDLRTALVRRGCAHCGNKDNLTVGECLLRDAGLVSFCHDRGLDLTRTPIWELPFAATDRHTTARSKDPWEVAVEVSVGGDALELVVDETLAVVDRTRR